MSNNGYMYSPSLFIGTTRQGVPGPVFFDTHSAVSNNNPPGTLITGAPGRGKTFLLLTITAMSAILGKTTIVLDPKGDFLSLKQLEDEIPGITIINLASKSTTGLLDPFYMAKESSDKLNLVIQVIDFFVGGITPDQLTVLSPIVQDVMNMPNPSLQKVTEELKGSTKIIAQQLGTQLQFISKTPVAKVCFSPNGNKNTISIDKGLTIINLMALEMPGPNGPEGRNQQLSAGILFLITDFIRRVMMNDNSRNPKTLVIDEVHALASTPAGAKIIKDVALLGRSKNLAIVMATQNNSHIKNLDIENTITNRFAFGTDRKEAASLIESMGLSKEQGFEDVITELKTGTCLMKDWDGGYSIVKITNYNTKWNNAFETNPIKKAMELAAKK